MEKNFVKGSNYCKSNLENEKERVNQCQYSTEHATELSKSHLIQMFQAPRKKLAQTRVESKIVLVVQIPATKYIKCKHHFYKKYVTTKLKKFAHSKNHSPIRLFWAQLRLN